MKITANLWVCIHRLHLGIIPSPPVVWGVTIRGATTPSGMHFLHEHMEQSFVTSQRRNGMKEKCTSSCTRRHNSVRDALFGVAQTAYLAPKKEERHLISDNSCPGDITTVV